MANDLLEALTIQQHLVGLAEGIRNNGFDRSYLTPDGLGYALAVQGESAKLMDDFMKAVGRYLKASKERRSDDGAARLALLKALDLWLAKQKV